VCLLVHTRQQGDILPRIALREPVPPVEGLLRSERGYVEKTTGLGRAQTTRLITVYLRRRKK
jgi:hypothetical protein